MGDKDREPFQLSFNGFLKVDFQGSRVTSDGGLLLVRELDERLGLGRLIDEHLTDTRQGENLIGLMAVNRELIAQAEGGDGTERVVLDMDSTESPVHGQQEQWIKEGKQATSWTRLSCHRFLANEVRLQLAVLPYNLGNLWRRLGLPQRIRNWSLTSWQQRLMKTGGRLVTHARYYWLLLAEGHLNRRLSGDMLHRIWALPLPSG